MDGEKEIVEEEDDNSGDEIQECDDNHNKQDNIFFRREDAVNHCDGGIVQSKWYSKNDNVLSPKYD